MSVSRPGTALDRLSVPVKRPAPVRPRDATELLVQTVSAQARVGRVEAELPRAGRREAELPSAGKKDAARSRASRKEAEAARVGAAAGGPELEPASIAQRRTVSVSRANKAGSAQAPLYSSPIAEANGIRYA